MKRFLLLTIFQLIIALPLFSQTIITVNQPTDVTIPGGCTASNCTFRQAVLDANNLPNTELVEIHFNLPSGSEVISMTGLLPAIEQPGLVIDGSTQPGASCGSLINGIEHNLIVELDGSATNTGPGMRGPDQVLKGLVIRDFPNDGTQISGDRITLECNYIGTDVTGTLARANNAGIRLFGDGTLVSNNLISGNATDGIHFTFDGDDSFVEGNLIGTSANGESALPNLSQGISMMNGANGNMIGGSTNSKRNLISGNAIDGIRLQSSDNTVSGNYIGTNRTGSAPIPNQTGIVVRYSNNVIGGSAPGSGNVISGNSSIGLYIASVPGQISQNNLAEGNFIGTDATGNVALANIRGIQLTDCSDNTIKDNLISGNLTQGIYAAVGGVPARFFDNAIVGNKIGVNVTASAAIPNQSHGIEIKGSGELVFPRATQIGGSQPGDGNVISGNMGSGIRHESGEFKDTNIQGNMIGTNGTGTIPIPNEGMAGVELSSGHDTLVRNNVISGNEGMGLFIAPFARRSVITNNYLGTNDMGLDLGNSQDGIKSFDDCEIGSVDSDLGNTIAYNGGAGVALRILVSRPCTILGNSIYANDGLGIDLEANNLPNVNDNLDSDTGSNDQLNHPIINSVAQNGGATANLDISYHGLTNRSFRIEIFTNDTADPSGFGEGEIFRSSFNITTNISGNYSGVIALPAGLFPAGTWVTATATIDGVAVPSSEFSPAVMATGTAPNLTLSAKAFLRGPYDGNGAMTTSLSDQNLAPLSQSYTGLPWSYSGTESLASLPNDMVDWILVELRATTNGSTLAQVGGLLMENGDITDLDGFSSLQLEGASPGHYYVVLRHRLHLDVMSSSAVDFTSGSASYDFSTGLAKAFGVNAMADLGDGRFAMWEGDGNADDSISSFDFLQEWLPQNGGPLGYYTGDFNMSGDVTAFDFLNAFLPGNGQSSQIP